MKKLLVLAITMALSVSMAACGSKPAASSSEPAQASSSSAPASSEASSAAGSSAAAGEYTPEQLAVAEEFAAMSDRYTALADQINADQNLLGIQELVDTMNILADAINEDDKVFADPAGLTNEVLGNLTDGIAVGNSYLAELEAMVANYAGKTIVTVAVEIINQTDAELYGLNMSPSNDDNWGGNLLTEPLASGESGTTQMTFTEETLVWDLRASDVEGNAIEFMGLDFAQAPMEGAKLMLAVQDGSYYASFVTE